MLASQATAVKGSPCTALPKPELSGAPFLVTSTECWAGPRPRVEFGVTYHEDAAAGVSAMVS